MYRYFHHITPEEYRDFLGYKECKWSKDGGKSVSRLEGITDLHRFEFSRGSVTGPCRVSLDYGNRHSD